jgi:hypothetical protein
MFPDFRRFMLQKSVKKQTDEAARGRRRCFQPVPRHSS